MDTPTSKACNLCEKTMAFTEFNKSKHGRHGYMNVCKSCRKSERAKLNYVTPTSGKRVCPKCKVEKEVNNFYKDKHSSFGLQTYCKGCSIYNSQVWASTYEGFLKKLIKEIEHNAKKRAKDLTLNITLDDIKELFIKQNGLCALSGLKMTYNSLPENKTHEHIINYHNISVDRIDSTKGYEKDNIQLVCAIVNRMKTDMKDSTFIDFCKIITQYNT